MRKKTNQPAIDDDIVAILNRRMAEDAMDKLFPGPRQNAPIDFGSSHSIEAEEETLP